MTYRHDLRHSLLTSKPIKQQKSDSFSEPTSLEKKKSMLYRLNAVAAVLHFLSFVGALIMSIIFASQSYKTELRTDFLVYSGGEFATESNSLGKYPVIWVDLPFPIITALFHAAIAWVEPVRKYYMKTVLEEQKGNILRWIEYSITASLMTWVIMQLSGVTNVFVLVVVGVIVNIALQWQGYLQEKMKGKSWVPTAVGWLLFVGQWTIIFAYFFAATTSPRPPGSPQVPWFVFTIVIGLFFMFACFGFVQLAYVSGVPKFMASAYAQEIGYLVLSFTAKFFLTWNLLIGASLNSQ